MGQHLEKIKKMVFGEDEIIAKDVFLTEEAKIRADITSLLKKQGTKVSMAPKSKRYFIINKGIRLHILIDGSAELVKISNHSFKYGWKFRDSFINEMIDVAIDWIEKDRDVIEEEIFLNEMNLLDDIQTLIETLPDVVEINLTKVA